MRRLLSVVIIGFFLVTSGAFAADDKVITFYIYKKSSGGILNKTLRNLGTKEAAAAITAACAAFGIDCSSQSAAGTAAIAGYIDSHDDGPQDSRPIWYAPNGYQICRATWYGNYISGSTFNGTIQDGGRRLNMYISTPVGRFDGPYYVDGYVRLYLIPVGASRSHYQCEGFFDNGCHIAFTIDAG